MRSSLSTAGLAEADFSTAVPDEADFNIAVPDEANFCIAGPAEANFSIAVPAEADFSTAGFCETGSRVRLFSFRAVQEVSSSPSVFSLPRGRKCEG